MKRKRVLFQHFSIIFWVFSRRQLKAPKRHKNVRIFDAFVLAVHKNIAKNTKTHVFSLSFGIVKCHKKIKKSHNLLFDYYKFMLRILIKGFYFQVKRIMWNNWKGIAHLHKNVFFWWWSAVCWHCLFKSLSKIHLFWCVWAANNSVNVDYWRTFFTHPSKRFEFVYFSFFHLGNSSGIFMCFFL